MKQITAILIGAGNRGMAYTNAMKDLPDKFKVIAVAEPIDSRRNYIKEAHNIPDDMCFTDWKPLLEKGKIADIAIIATMDRDHYAPAIATINAGYDLLLEKPIAPTAEECIEITRLAQKNNVKIVIGTVLRYTAIFNKIKEIIDSGKLGKIMSINHEEGVGNVHQSHSFVRGNWGNSDRSSTMLLQKSCHDTDILYWLLGKKCLKVQSYGALSYFKKENAPKGSPEYCIDGCPVGDTCPYNAIKLYMEDQSYSDWFRGAATREHNPTPEMVEHTLRTTQYGKCVYKCDNNVVDHQTVNMLFEDDITVTFNMNAFNKGGRHIHIMGTKGELHAATNNESPIEIYDFESEEKEIIPIHAGDGITSGHGGGDVGIVNTLYDYMNDNYNSNSIPEIGESCYSHYIAFAAEVARKSGIVVDVDRFISKIQK